MEAFRVDTINRVRFTQIAALNGSLYAVDTNGYVWVLWRDINGDRWERVESPEVEVARPDFTSKV